MFRVRTFLGVEGKSCFQPQKNIHFPDPDVDYNCNLHEFGMKFICRRICNISSLVRQ